MKGAGCHGSSPPGGCQTEGSGVSWQTLHSLAARSQFKSSHSLNNAQACLVRLDLREALK